MSFTFGFYNSIDGDRKYNAEQVSSIFDGLIHDGVFDSIGDIFATTPGDGLQVIVGSGKAWFHHTWNVNDAALPLPLDPPDILLPRIDAVVLEINNDPSVRSNRIRIVKGNPASIPEKPTMVRTSTDGINQYALSYIRVDQNVTSIAKSKIEINVGKSTCPFVTSIIQSTDIDALFNQWNGEFDEWFDNIKLQLTDDVVTNLQRQIDDRLKIVDKATPEEAATASNNTKYLTPKSLENIIGGVYDPIKGKLLNIKFALSHFLPSKTKVSTEKYVPAPPDQTSWTKTYYRIGSSDYVGTSSEVMGTPQHIFYNGKIYICCIAKSTRRQNNSLYTRKNFSIVNFTIQENKTVTALHVDFNSPNVEDTYAATIQNAYPRTQYLNVDSRPCYFTKGSNVGLIISEYFYYATAYETGNYTHNTYIYSAKHNKSIVIQTGQGTTNTPHGIFNNATTFINENYGGMLIASNIGDRIAYIANLVSGTTRSVTLRASSMPYNSYEIIVIGILDNFLVYLDKRTNTQYSLCKLNLNTGIQTNDIAILDISSIFSNATVFQLTYEYGDGINAYLTMTYTINNIAYYFYNKLLKINLETGATTFSSFTSGAYPTTSGFSTKTFIGTTNDIAYFMIGSSNSDYIYTLFKLNKEDGTFTKVGVLKTKCTNGEKYPKYSGRTDMEYNIGNNFQGLLISAGFVIDVNNLTIDDLTVGPPQNKAFTYGGYDLISYKPINLPELDGTKITINKAYELGVINESNSNDTMETVTLGVGNPISYLYTED